MRAVLGLDIGTTTVKVVVVGENGVRLSEGFSDPIPLHSPEVGRAEQDPEALWNAVLQAMSDAHAAAYHLVGIAVAAQSGSVIALGQEDRALGRLITWQDNRAAGIVESWESSHITAEIRSISGWAVTTGLGLPLIAWMAQQEPDTFKSARRFAGPGDFITHRLTGEWTTNPSNAAGMQLLDLVTSDWSLPLCEFVGLVPEQLSKVIPSGSLIGHVHKAAAASTGLRTGLPVINGGHDQTCAALALGVVEPGHVMVGCGTAWVVTAATKKPSAPPYLSINHHVVRDRFTVSRSLGNLGAEIDNKAGPAILASLRDPAIVGSGGTGSFVATGGWMQGGHLPQRLADVTGFRIRVPIGTAWPAVGAATLAAMSLELVPLDKFRVECREFLPS